MKKLFKLVTVLGLTVLLSACGGAGGGGGGSSSNIDDAEPGLNIAIFNASTSQLASSIPENEDATVEVLLLDDNGSPLAGEIVNFNVTLGGALLSQNIALTNASGIASVDMFSPDVALGSDVGTVVVSSGLANPASANFEFTATNTIDPEDTETGIQLTMTRASDGVEENSITIDDVANLLITLYDNNGDPLADEVVTLSVTSGTPSQNSVLTDDNGEARITISPPEDLTFGTAPGTITASSTASTQNGVLNYEFVATTVTDDGDPAVATSIEFNSVSQEFISLKGTGTSGFGESALVTFTVFDGSSTVSNITVNFVLTTSVGGITFANGLTETTAVSNAQGQVTALVNAGDISTPVRVTAFVDLPSGETIFVQSSVLTITTGIPDQNSISLSFNKFAAEGADFDGDNVEVTVRLGDRFNNPVPDGTAVSFTTEGGRIDASCTTTNSQCSVQWESQNPRPEDNRATVLAHVIGHETYYDENGTGIFDNGDEFDDLPEAFRDDDEDGVYNPDAQDGFGLEFARDEIFIDYDSSATYSSADGLYNGVPCEHDSLCAAAGNSSLINVRETGQIIMASSSADITIREAAAGVSSCLDANGKIIDDGINCSSLNAIAFPAGASTVKLWVLVEDSRALCTTAAPDYSSVPFFTRVDSADPDDAACIFATRQSAATGSTIDVSAEVGELSEVPVDAVDNRYGPQEFFVFLSSSDANEEDESGALQFSVTSPQGNVSSVGISVFDPADP